MASPPEVDSPVPVRDDESPQVDINIRTVDGETYEYTVNRFEQVNTLITQLESQIEVPEGHTIRLIHSGRILNPTDTFAQHRIESGTFVHAQVSEVQSRSRSSRRNRRVSSICFVHLVHLSNLVTCTPPTPSFHGLIFTHCTVYLLSIAGAEPWPK